MARLDRLPQVRELAQLGSVLGREFAYDMISGLSTLGDTLLQEGLSQLVETELLYQRGRPPRARYVFKHALVQDAAYGSLLRRSRQQAHRQVAELLEARFPETVQTHPELLAHHLAEAGQSERAVEHYLKAGAQALRTCANIEAIAHLDKGLEIVGAMPAGPERDRHELDLLMTLGPALIATKGYAAPDVEPAYRRALELCEALGDVERQFSVLLGLSLFHYVRANLLVSRNLAEQLVELAKTHPEPGCDLAAERALGYAHVMLGDIPAARSCMDHVAESYDIAVHGGFAVRRGGSDFGVGASSMGSWILFTLGYPDQANGRSAKGVALAVALDHPISAAFAHWCAGMVHLLRGEPAVALEHASATAEIAEERGFPQYAAWGSALRGAAQFAQGGGAEAIAEFRKGLDDCTAIGSKLFAPFLLFLLADAYGQNDQAEEGLAVIVEAFDQVAWSDERFAEAELHRVKGELLLLADAANAFMAEVSFLKAIEVAQSQEAKAWELRAATSLARLWQRQDKQAEAHELLAGVYGWFTEGFDTADLVAARKLLDGMDDTAPRPATAVA